MGLKDKFRRFIKEHQLFSRDEQLLVAVSGGQDSVVLTLLLHQLEFQIGIAHVNFKLRGKESDGDAAFVEQLSNDLKVPFHLHEADCKTYAQVKQRSIQEAAREIRYGFFDQIKESSKYQYILTAHHAGDNMESIIYNLVKGTTLPVGIPRRRDDILRPLLTFSKAEIQDYCTSNNVQYRLDASNQEDKYARNYIRHHIVDHLKHLNPSVEKTITAVSSKADQYKSWVSSILTEDAQRLAEQGSLDLKTHVDLPYKGVWLYELLRPYGITWSAVVNIWSANSNKETNGQQFNSESHQFILDRGVLKMVSHQSESINEAFIITSIDTCMEETKGQISMKSAGTPPLRNKEVAILDLSKINFPLTLRRWRDGDRFQPVGMHGRNKKIKKFLTDSKVPATSKKDIMVLVQEDQIIWVVGHRVDQRFAATADSNSILLVIMGKEKS